MSTPQPVSNSSHSPESIVEQVRDRYGRVA